MPTGINSAYLSLNVGNLVKRECILVQRHLGDLQEPQEAKLGRQEEEQTLSTFASSSCPPDTVNVVARVIGRIKLNNPIHFRDIQPSRCNICAEENASVCIAELEEGRSPLLLLLFALYSTEASVHNTALRACLPTCRSRTGTSI